MSADLSTLLEELGWTIHVDTELEELRLIHLPTEHTFILDADGNLTVPGDDDIGGTLRELQSLLTSALELYGGDGPCSIECEEAVNIQSATGITLDAPSVEISADVDLEMESNGTIDMASAGSFNAEASGVMDLKGSLLKLN